MSVSLATFRGPVPVTVLLALAFLAAHLPTLARTPDDIDSVNFVLGVRDFDVARHQPHPPGYPVYIALGKVANAAVSTLPGWRSVSSDGVVPEARALALLSALFAALAALPLVYFFTALEGDGRRALAATALTLASPLVWFTAGRALSDLPGLALALVALALLVTPFTRDHAAVPGRERPAVETGVRAGASSRRLLVFGALVTGLAVGMRSQTLWLTMPVLIVVLLDRIGRDGARVWLGATMALTLGALAWVLPLTLVSGGLGEYLRVLSLQATEDFAGVEMLATGLTLREVAFAVIETFVSPWGSPLLAGVILGLAGVGGVAMIRRSRRGLVLIAAVSVPYAIFHLAFQEVVTVRYAIPLLPSVSYLAVRGVDAFGRGLLAPVTLAATLTCLTVAVPALAAFAQEPSPTFRALTDMRARLAEPSAARPVLAMHYVFGFALRGERLDLDVLPTRPRREWLDLVKYWSDGGRAPMWVLVEPHRMDLGAIDRTSLRLIRAYRWPLASMPLLGGTRPGPVDWYEVNSPRWFVAEGWHLTPELAGVATQLGAGPGERPIEAYVRRSQEDVTLLVGGRHVGQDPQPGARLTLTLDGRVFDSWSVGRRPGFFLRLLTIPATRLEGPGNYARLTLAADALDGSGRIVSIAIEQFDAQPLDSPMRAFGVGWHELEYNPSTGRSWRWTSESATVHIVARRGVTLRLSGESPLRYFPVPPQVRVRAGSQQLATFAPGGDFEYSVPIRADTLRNADGAIVIETTATFVPDERSGSGDRRRLGLRMYDLRVE